MSLGEKGFSTVSWNVAPGQGAQVKDPYPTVATGRDGRPVLVVSAYE